MMDGPEIVDGPERLYRREMILIGILLLSIALFLCCINIPPIT
jgi:hypothetical protein